MSNFLKGLLCTLFLLSYGAAYAQDSTADREAAVERYFNALPFDVMIAEMSAEMAKNMPEDQRADFIDLMTKEVRLNVVMSTARASLVKHLTTDEINAFSAFVESPLGKSATFKMKYYMADLMPVIQAEVIRALNSR